MNQNAKVGIGGGPTRCTILPKDAAARKAHPIATGFLNYFPDAIALIAHLSFTANEQHNPGEPVHWARGKSTDHDDTFMRHCLQRGTFDDDGHLHDVKVAWRALANLQEEIERRVKTGEPVCLTKYHTLPKPKPKSGDRVQVKKASSGAYGAIGRYGTLQPEGHAVTHGLHKGPVVVDDSGFAWGLGRDYEVELVEPYSANE